MKQKKVRKIITSSILFVLALLYVAKFGGPSILRLYVSTGLGECHKQAIFCILPQHQINNPKIDEEYLQGLKSYKFLNAEISVPKELKVTMGEITKTYYKKRPWLGSNVVVYLLYEKPDFFVELFPQVRKQGVTDDYEFLNRTMSARVDTINTVSDAFFVIMKSLFTPDLGDQKNARIIRFALGGKRGFISYNAGAAENYYDCNMLDAEQNFFKVYIKDKSGKMSLEQVFTIISTVKKTAQQS